MRIVRFTAKFKKDIKRIKRRGKDTEILRTVITHLVTDGQLDIIYRDHALSGNYAGTRECHLQPDWLLIYRLIDNELVLVRTGTHADLF